MSAEAALAKMDIATQWDWWRSAVEGNRQPLPTNQEPQSGYFRDRGRAVAIWRTEKGIHHSVTGGPKYASLDTLNDAFGRFCMKPISEDLFFAISDGNPWPEEVAAEIEAQRPAGIGHNSGMPHELAKDTLDAIATAYRTWLKDIGGKVLTEEHSEKAKGFQDRALAVEKDIKVKHEIEKAPYLAAAREIDARWISGPTSIKAQAEALKKSIGTDRTPYLLEKDRIAKEEQRKAAEERERHRLEQARLLAEKGSVNAPAELPPPPPRKVATGLRTFYRAEITDLPKVAAMIAGMANPPPDFVEIVQSIALKMLRSGVEVEGAKLIEERRA